MTPIEQLKTLTSIIEDVNHVLSENGIHEVISLADVTITDKTVSDLVKPNGKLSEAITSHLWPSISSETVYHYTSTSVAEVVLRTNSFRLTNIEKRYGEGEIETFCKTHHLDGYLEKDETGNPRYRSLIMPNTYYASFTSSDLTADREEYFWRTFASCNGVRLKFKLTASNPNFRRIKYERRTGEPIPILAGLTDLVREKYGRKLILKGISRLCSFYLSGEDYGIESEFRALYRTWNGFGPQPIGNGPNSYLELPLGYMSESGYQLDVLEVHANNKPKMPDSFLFTQRNA